ncbi:MAG: hypothetical protein A4E66_01264 [Syntrophus sp. PtaB.Bin001]|nr:MAG: hypothetical protein A4E66_01264 [Syntrophus sp. PtaB.Bin001]
MSSNGRRVFLLISLLFLAIVKAEMSYANQDDYKIIKTSKWTFKVTGFRSGLQEAIWDQMVLYSTKEVPFKDKQFIMVEGLFSPVEKKDKYVLDVKLKLNGEQSIIFVEMIDQKGQISKKSKVGKSNGHFIAMGDIALFDQSKSFEFKSTQFPVKMNICFSLPANVQSFEFSMDDSEQIKLGNLQKPKDETKTIQKNKNHTGTRIRI